MLIYFLVLAALTSAAVASDLSPNKARQIGVIATLTMVMFAGLRFETGHDWLNYTSSYLDAQILPAAVGDLSSHPLDAAFFLLTITAKTAGLNVSSYLFFLAAIGILPIHFVVSKVTRNVALVWAVLFGLTFLISQMTMVRQSIAISLFLLALLWSIERKPLLAGVSIVLALCTHVTVMALAPVLLLARWRPSTSLTFVFLLSGAVVAVGKINLLEEAAPLAVYLPIQAGLKLAIYGATESSRITIGSFSMILFHTSVLAFLLYRTSSRDLWANAAIWLTILTLAAHLFLFGLPTVWNRAMMAALPVEIAVVWRAMQKTSLSIRLSGILALSSLSAVGLVYFLLKPTALPFTPYQSIPAVAASGKCGDGLERLIKAQKLAVFVDAKKIPKNIADADPTTHASPQTTQSLKDLIHSSYGFCSY